MIDFDPIELNFDNVDRYIVKKKILQFLKDNLTHFQGELIDVGCGEMPYKQLILQNSSISSYHGVDLVGGKEYKAGVKPDFLWDGVTFPFEDDSFGSAIATEVLEHCPDPSKTLSEIYRILKPNSPFILTVPFIWPTHETPYDFYRYTPFGLKHLLEMSGFLNIEVSCLGGWDASLSQVLGLWLKRRKMSKSNQKILFFVIKPIINFLLKKDKILNPYTEQNLITSIGVVAWKI